MHLAKATVSNWIYPFQCDIGQMSCPKLSSLWITAKIRVETSEAVFQKLNGEYEVFQKCLRSVFYFHRVTFLLILLHLRATSAPALPVHLFHLHSACFSVNPHSALICSINQRKTCLALSISPLVENWDRLQSLRYA